MWAIPTRSPDHDQGSSESCPGPAPARPHETIGAARAYACAVPGSTCVMSAMPVEQASARDAAGIDALLSPEDTQRLRQRSSLMHDASHRLLFAQATLTDRIGSDPGCAAHPSVRA